MKPKELGDKKFAKWSKRKTQIHEGHIADLKFREREVWWCAFGLNIGVEIDGKHDSYERPAVILRRINKDSAFVVPTTSKQRDDEFHVPIQSNGKTSFVKLNQLRVISTKRLLRKVDTISRSGFVKVQQALVAALINIESRGA